jgi:hypothetical protein
MFGIDENKINVIKIPQGNVGQIKCVKEFLKDITDVSRIRLMSDNYSLLRVLSNMENIQKGEFIIFYSKHTVDDNPMFNKISFRYDYDAKEFTVNRKKYKRCDMEQLSKLYNRKKLIKKLKNELF